MNLEYSDEILVRQVAAMIWLGRRYPRSPAYYQEAGLALAAMKLDRPRELWLRIVREHCGISPRRAYQLMVLASRKRSLEELRLEAAVSSRKYRAARWLTTKPPRRKGPKTPV